jgi:hypothetical protein
MRREQGKRRGWAQLCAIAAGIVGWAATGTFSGGNEFTFHPNRRRGTMVTSAQKRKVHKVMSEKKHGTLRSGSGKKVKSRKQAIAIAMSESGQSRKQSRKRKGAKKRSR